MAFTNSTLCIKRKHIFAKWKVLYRLGLGIKVKGQKWPLICTRKWGSDEKPYSMALTAPFYLQSTTQLILTVVLWSIT
jgi:hypothetical protein